MNEIEITKDDELIMKLIHYFITEHNYKPVVVHGGKDEVWLENLDNERYKLIRLNSNYIHNKEQLNLDNYKVETIIKQIKKKTFSFKCNTLNILLNSNIDVNDNSHNIDTIVIKNDKDIKKSELLSDFVPSIGHKISFKEKGMNLLSKLSGEISNHNTDEIRKVNKIFKTEKPIVTYILIGINILAFLMSYLYDTGESNKLLTDFALYPAYVVNGEWYRLITATFLHADIFHILFNMYALNIIGSQIENYYGKIKFLIIYFVSGIVGNLFSILLTNSWSLGASGAIFGLLGSILYFGYNYRLYLGSVLKSQIIPLIAVNLLLGFIIPNIDVSGHIGGLIGGILISMAIGIKEKKNKSDRINGIIMSIILIGFLIYMAITKIS